MCKGRNAKEIRRTHKKIRLKNEFVQVVVKSKKGQKSDYIYSIRKCQISEENSTNLGKWSNWPKICI